MVAMASLATSALIPLCFIFMCVAGVCFAAVYPVGDSEGWTSNGKVDYKNWVSGKTFFVGDAFFFQYDYKLNDVIEVSREDFESCNVGAPLNYYGSGRDRITMWKPGHYYYICSFPGHCQAGQKVDIRALQSPSPAPSPTSPSPSDPMPPTPDHQPAYHIPPSSSPSPSSTTPPTPMSHPPSATTITPSSPPTHSVPSGSPPSPGPISYSPATPENSPHSSPPLMEAPPPSKSKNSAPSSVSFNSLQLAVQLLMALGFLAYYY
ncbi:Mavicyanin [Morella rubra]|uniref:Mavicyanin n=1 Tax=Morella rubra TaxID=262757 RepID=A0A6A1WHW1_9ROSI|nr:Mavicyanin [Morella rubra]